MNAADFLKNELYGWKAWEACWLLFSCAVILGLSIYWGDSPIGAVAAITGIAYVVLTGKGKLSAYFFGIINVVLYAAIAFETRFYGEVMLNLLYYLPMLVYGFYVWSRHMDPETHEVEKRRMTHKGLAILFLIVAVSTFAYGFFLRAIGGYLGFLDAFSTVMSVVAMVLTVRMYAEQWLLWIIVDAASVIMWAVAFTAGSSHISTLAMWAIYLANGIIMYIKWMRESKPKEAE